MINKSINKKYWSSFNNEELKKFEKQIFDMYRKNGFPYFDTSMEFRLKEYNKLKNYDYSKIFDKDLKIIKQSMHGLSLAWSYMPHAFDVKCNNNMSPLEAFNNDEIFKKVIKKRLKYGDNISKNGIRKTLKIFSGVQSVSNFRPTAAAYIYSHFCEKDDIVWDMSSGYGGRLLGAHLANVYYIGTEPASLTYQGLINLSKDFGIKSKIIKNGSEETYFKENSLDLCFTSPPYFNTEKYSNEHTQSYLKYNNKKDWIEKFLEKTFLNAYKGLKKNKYMVINIANTKTFKNLEEETIKSAEKIGFVLEDVWKLALSNINKNGYKYEPIFIFKKN